MNNDMFKFPHEITLTDPKFTNRIVVRRTADGKLEHNVPHTLVDRSYFGFNVGSAGERGQHDLALNICHHLLTREGLTTALGKEVYHTRCGRKVSKTASILADYVRWTYLDTEDADNGVNLKTSDIVAFIRDMITKIKAADDRRAAQAKKRKRASKKEVTTHA